MKFLQLGEYNFIVASTWLKHVSCHAIVSRTSLRDSALDFPWVSIAKIDFDTTDTSSYQEEEEERKNDDSMKV